MQLPTAGFLPAESQRCCSGLKTYKSAGERQLSYILLCAPCMSRAHLLKAIEKV